MAEEQVATQTVMCEETLTAVKDHRAAIRLPMAIQGVSIAILVLSVIGHFFL